MRAALVLALAFALTGCGGAREHGTATLWVTRDRGAHVLYSGKVPAGLTALQALDRRTDVKTRYGGRFVQAIDGVQGDAGKQRDWFYFVNGIEASKGAADVRLRSGDIEWWDYRSWQGGAMSVPVVVGAFPEPFLHGFEGTRHHAAVEYGRPRNRAVAERLAHLVRTQDVFLKSPPLPGFRSNLIVIAPFARPDESTISLGPGKVVTLQLGERAARRLANDPTLARYRYQGLR